MPASSDVSRLCSSPIRNYSSRLETVCIGRLQLQRRKLRRPLVCAWASWKTPTSAPRRKWFAAVYERHLKAYDAQGRLVLDQALKANGAARSLLVNEQFDAAGKVLRYRTESMVGEHVRNDYVTTYRTLAKSVVQSSSTGRMTLLSGKTAGRTGSFATSTDVYDANGFLIGVTYSTDGNAPASGTSNKMFILDAQGNILLGREESHNSPTAEQRQIVANGELQLRFSTNYGQFDHLEQEQERAFWKAYNDDVYQSMVTPGGDLVVEAGASASTGQVVVAAQGDTLQSIAARVYGSPDAWYRLADANNLDFDSVLVAGQTVVAPGATATSNKLDFDLGKLVGSTAPNLPPPPPPSDNKNCIMLIIVVVAVVVAAVVAPYMLSFAAGVVGGGATAATASSAGLMLAGAMTGAVANVASQAVAVAAGVQDKLEWKGVAMAAVGGAVSAGFNTVTSNAFVSAAASSVVTQGIEVMTGMQKTFSWAAVARAAVSAGTQSVVEAGDFGAASGRNGATGQFSLGFFRGGLSGLAGSLTTDLLIPGKQDWVGIGIGALGGGLAGGLAQLRAYNASEREDSLLGNAPRSGQVEQIERDRKLGELHDRIAARARDRGESISISEVPEPDEFSVLGLTAAINMLPAIASEGNRFSSPPAQTADNLERTLGEVRGKMSGGIDIPDGAGLANVSKTAAVELSSAAMTKLYGPAGIPSKLAIMQGGIGDCYFLASILATTVQSPDLIKSLITENSDGTYTVKWNMKGVAPATGITAGPLQVADVTGITETTNGIYAQLLEKAAASHFGTSFGDGGLGAAPLALLTGRTNIHVYSDASPDGLGLNNGGSINVVGYKFNPKDPNAVPPDKPLEKPYTVEKLHEDFKSGAIIVAGTGKTGDNRKDKKLVPEHMYAITGVTVGPNPTVEVTNPWGKDVDYMDEDVISALINGGATGTKPHVVVLTAKYFFMSFEHVTVAKKR